MMCLLNTLSRTALGYVLNAFIPFIGLVFPVICVSFGAYEQSLGAGDCAVSDEIFNM